ncbi:MAG: rhodanese-like domain-containing protein [Deltaproteobacteria bacterium]|nr:rhodanese-like domain-containing protein [Deltaproteobacteria bacterium]
MPAKHTFTRALLLALGLAALVAGPALAAEPHVMAAKNCLGCHTEFGKMQNIVAGEVQSVSKKAKSLQVATSDADNLIIQFTDQTKVKNVGKISDLKKPIPVLVKFVKKGDDLVATEVVAKPKIKVPANQLLDVKDMAKLVAEGPEKGNFVLFDSRPPMHYQEGHIAGAISLPFPAMPKKMDMLPKDKGKLIVFYCGGFR